MPEFLEVRYSKSARFYLSIVSVLSYIITKISATIFAGAIIFECLGVPFWTGAFIVVLVTGLYTVLGGLKAVVYTDTVQVFIMIIGSIIITLLGLDKLGGYQELVTHVPSEFFNFWKPMNDPEFPWTGIIFGAPILGVWYWCTDQFIVQRVLSAKNLEHARKATIFAGYLKILPLFIFVFPGIICYALVTKDSLSLKNFDQSLPVLIAYVLPSGLKGLMLASLLSALMSSLSSVFNSCSTLITYDFYKSIKPQAKERELVVFGQIMTAVLVVLGMLWIPLMKHISGNLFTYIQSVQAYVSPPIASVFLLGILFKKLNAKGAIASLYTGFVLGVARLTCEIFKDSIPSFLSTFTNINFLHFALVLFCVCSLVLILVSLATQDKKAPENIIFKSSAKLPEDKAEKSEILLSAVMVLLIFGLWYFYS